MKRFNPDDWVFVTKVPARARFIMQVGTPAVVLSLDRYHPDIRKQIDDSGLVMIRSLNTGFTFWWSENDLEFASACCGRFPVSKSGAICADGAGCKMPLGLTVVDEAHYLPKLVDTERGYDPYNSVPCWRAARYAKY